MPTYQYACTDCGDRTEVVQRFTDDPLTVCAVCGGKLRKVFSPVGIVFKGSGFYRTDSRDGSSTVSAGKDGAKDGVGKEPAASGSNGSAEGSSGSDGSKSGSSGSGSDGGTTKSAGSADGGKKSATVGASSSAS